MKVFRSRIGWELWIPVGLLLGTLMAIMVSKGIWIGVTILAITAVLMILLVLSIRYTINDGYLIVGCFGVNEKIRIQSIHRIRKTLNPISSPAAALIGRLEVSYGSGHTIIISPSDREKFISSLLEENKSILTFEAF